MKMHDEINKMRKEYVHEQYSRIVEYFKDYEKISRVKMLDEIYKVYDDPDNIIDICTTRELKFLKMILDNKSEEDFKDKYDWEKTTLRDKFLIDLKKNIPEEIIKKVKQALKRVNWEEKQKTDELNELLVSYCKIHGSVLLSEVCQFGSNITEINPEIIWDHMLNNRLFNYYVFIIAKNIDGIDEDIPVAIFQDYYAIEEEIEEQRRKQRIVGDKKIDLKMAKTLFYNEFDINNPKIIKFLEELEKLPFYWFLAIDAIKQYAMLNLDRKNLKEFIKKIPLMEFADLTNFFKVLDEAMDEMPSGALNGYTPNEVKEIKKKMIKSKKNKSKKNVRQKNACLSKKDAELFYKIYFGLLEFTNKKYKINEHLKIYNNNGIDPSEIVGIIDKYWENKEAVTLEFCLANPYKFSKEELSITAEFKKGIRDMFIVSKFELEYTAFMSDDKIYMVKGVKGNLDNVIPRLPYVVVTSIIPFKENLVYDGILSGLDIKMFDGLSKLIEKEYNVMLKYYHL